ncbi:MAG: magnesium chelatase subunit H [Pseudomonadota bacterium]
MQKHITPAEAKMAAASVAAVPIKVVIVTLDNHMSGTAERARLALADDIPGLDLRLHAVADWADSGAAKDACRDDILTGDIVVANMIFLEDHVRTLTPWLEEARAQNDCTVCSLAAAEIVKLTKMGDFDMAKPTGGALGLLKRLRGKHKKGGSAGSSQMKMLRAIPRLLKYIPGKAQDLRAYFMTLQYLLAGSDENIANLVRFLVSRYAAGDRSELKKTVKALDPVVYPEVGLFDPALPHGVTDDFEVYKQATGFDPSLGTVGVLIMRSYVLAKNTAHYEDVLRSLRARGINAVMAFASGLDARPAIEQFFMADGKATVDHVLSLTGFSLVGGPAYNDARAAEEALAALDVPYTTAFSSEFQTLEKWAGSDSGLSPIEATLMVSLPEIDGGTGPVLFAGRCESAAGCTGCKRQCQFDSGVVGADMQPCRERIDVMVDRVAKQIALRRTDIADRKVATIIYNFPPNGGAMGSAAFLSVFQSLFNTLTSMREAGYSVEVPESVDALRDAILEGNASQYGAPANVAHLIDAETHVRREEWLDEIEASWGPAPGRAQSDGRNIFVYGAQFGNVFIGVQPAFGYEGDPMRLLFEKGFAPTHAFAAFYRFLREDFGADAYLHFGTHGALEFMPGKHVGLSGDCWPDRLVGDVPNFYLYAANNPSEGQIARRRSAATLISYLTPPVGKAGLYKGLLDLKAAIDRWRASEPEAIEERVDLTTAIHAQAVALDMVEEHVSWSEQGLTEVPKLAHELHEYETMLIPHGLHVVGEPVSPNARVDMVETAREAMIEAGVDLDSAEQQEVLAALDQNLGKDHELPALLHALDGGYIRPVAGGDIVRSPDIVPTGRNIHGFDPFRLPSAFAVADGTKQAERLLQRLIADNGEMPKTVAMVLWGTDNLKSEGAPIAQALALIGAKPRFDSFGRLAGADLLPLSELGRPRVDVVMTLSGIFRDLLPLQTKLLAEASLEAVMAEDEPLDQNPIRAHALAYAEEHGCDLETAALRVFSNADGAYGANVNLLIESGAWDNEDELAEAFTARKGFAYGVDGKPVRQSAMLHSILKDVDAAYQNIESVELGVTSIDQYFDTLGGISRAIKKAGGKDAGVYVSDQTSGKGKVRTLGEQVALESRTRALNPKFYEPLLDSGFEGVRAIESHVTNTLGWSATTGQVAPWVYQNLAETFVLDPDMRRRMAELNPKSSAKLAGRLIEARDRAFWEPDDETWDALCAATEELEDRVEGIAVGEAA